MQQMNRARLLATTVLMSGFVVITVPAYAQDAEEQAEPIVVTGTRIKQPDFEFSNPILSEGQTALQDTGKTNVATILQDFPALVASEGPNDNAGSNSEIGTTGLNLLDLRNLGVDRTLVLVNGRRHVAALPGSAAVDTNTIPVDLLKDVQILTGGASAIYGADGVSGVVNFITKDDFEGFRMRVQGGMPGEGSGDREGLFSITAGKNFADGKGNIAAAFEATTETRLKASDRHVRSRFVRNPNDPFDDPSIPDRVPLPDIRYYESSPLGAVYTDADDLDALFGGPGVLAANYNGDGRVWNPGGIPFIAPFYAQGGDATPVDGYGGDLTPQMARYNFNVLGHYDFSDQVRFFTELKYVKTKSRTLSQPTFDYYLAVQDDNPFMPASIRDAIQASGIGVADFGAPTAFVSRDNFDLGRRGEDIDRETYRAVVGFEGNVLEGVDYNLSYTFGRTKVTNNVLRERLDDRWAAALDVGINPATGLADCKANYIPGYEPVNVSWNSLPAPTTFAPGECKPFNLFATNPADNAAASAWIAPTGMSKSELTQHVVSGYLSGNLDKLFTLPGGSFGWSVGAEWRREESDGGQSFADINGLGFGGATIQPTKGSYEVKEYFAEFRAPLIADQPFIKEFTVDGAVRQSSYSTIGDTTTWKVGGEWAPLVDVSFRGTYAEAVRAPNISELFDPGGQTFLFIEDPCDVARLNQGTSYRAANCAALLTSLGIDPTTYTDPNTASIRGLQSGNRNLEEETAKTTTFGVVLRPRFVPRLTASIDYYQIKLDNAINLLDPQDIANQCVDLPTTVNQFCGALTRAPSTDPLHPGGIVDFLIQPVNVAAFTTRGIDFTVNYLLDPADLGAKKDWGTFNFRVVGNYLDELSYVNLVGADPDQQKGQEKKPEWQANFDVTWLKGPWQVTYGFNYFSDTQRYTTLERQGEPDIAASGYLDYKARMTHDVQVRWSPDDNYTLYAGIDNFTDQRPDTGESFYPVSAVGRFFYVGATASFDSLGQMLSGK